MRRLWTAALALGTGLLLTSPCFAQGDLSANPSIGPEAGEDSGANTMQRQYIVIGQVESVDLDSDTVRIRNSQTDEVVPIVVPDNALVSMNGEAIPLEEVPLQSDALASFTEQGDQLVAKSLAISAPNAGSGKVPRGGDMDSDTTSPSSPSAPSAPDAGQDMPSE